MGAGFFLFWCPVPYNLSQIKPLLGIDLDDTTQDTQLNAALLAVGDQLQRLTRRRLLPVTIAEWYEGNWSRSLNLRETPVRSITSVERLTGDGGAWGEGDLSSLTALTNGEHYYLKLDYTLLVDPVVHVSMSGLLVNRKGWVGAIERRRGRVIPQEVPGAGNWKITYEAGFPAGQLPAEFLPAVAAGIAYLLNTIPTGGLLTTSESLDGRSLSLSKLQEEEFGQIGAVASMLARYRRAYVG